VLANVTYHPICFVCLFDGV